MYIVIGVWVTNRLFKVPTSSGGEMHIPAGDQLQIIGTDIKSCQLQV
jgi:hypothetical protein